MKLERVKSVEHLCELALQRRAVVSWRGHRTSAAFMIGCPGRHLVDEIKHGMFVYQPKKGAK